MSEMQKAETPKTLLLPRPTKPALPDQSAKKDLAISNLEKPTLAAQRNTNERSSKLKNMILKVLENKSKNGKEINDDLVIRVLSRFEITAMNIDDRKELVGKLKEYNPTISTESILAAEKPPALTKKSEQSENLNEQKNERTILWNEESWKNGNEWKGEISQIEDNMNEETLDQFNNSLAGLGIKLDDIKFKNLVRQVVLEKFNETNSELLKLKNTDLRGVIAMVKKSITEKLLQKNMFEVHQDYASNPKEGKTRIDRYFESLKDFDKNNPNTEIYKKMMAESLKVGGSLVDFSKNLAGKLALRELFNR